MKTSLNEKPILFSGPMVRAILDGRKTMTRRVVTPQPHFDFTGPEWDEPACCDSKGKLCIGPRTFAIWLEDFHIACPYQPGAQLWVRETFYLDDIDYSEGGVLPSQQPEDSSLYYRADGECCQQVPECACAEVGKTKWRPSIFMPRWASRITLEIAAVRCERVQDIGNVEVRAEGMELADTYGQSYPRAKWRGIFARTWDALNAKRGYSWEANPWVWVVEFRRINP